MLHSCRMLLGLATLAVLAGCQAVSPSGGANSFQLGVLVPSPPPHAVAVAAVPQAEAALLPEPVVSVAPSRSGGGSSRGSSGGSAPAPAPHGTLTVDLSGVTGLLQPAAQRRILATVEDIDRLIITLRIEGHPDQVQVVTAAELQAGKSSVEFTELPTGTCTLTIRAEDAAGTAIGTSSRFAPIAQAEDTELDVRVLIMPDDGNGWSWANSLTFGIDLQAEPVASDGTGPVSGMVLESYPIQAAGGLYADNAGHFYVRNILAGSSMQNWSGLTRFSSADGSFLANYTMSVSHSGGVLIVAPTSWAYDPVHGTLVTNSRVNPSIFLEPGDTSLRIIEESLGSPLAVDVAGDVYYIRQGTLQKVTQAETIATSIPAHSAFALDADGDLWVNGADTASGVTAIRPEVHQYAPDGTLLGTYALPVPAVRMISDGAGGVWVGDRPGGPIARVAADGTVGPALGVTATDFCLDGDRNLWVAGGPSLLKLAPDGTQLGAYPIKARVVTFGDGFVFAGAVGYPGTVLKIVP